MHRFLWGMADTKPQFDRPDDDNTSPRFSRLAQFGLLAALPLMAVFEVGDPVEANIVPATQATTPLASWNASAASASGPNQQMAMALADEYQAMAERYGSGRPSGAPTPASAMFDAKGRMASEGHIPLPEQLSAQHQTATNGALMWDARQRLNGAFDQASIRHSDGQFNPSLILPAAKAQVFFDCWIAHATTKEHVAANCQDRFESALAVLSGADPITETATP